MNNLCEIQGYDVYTKCMYLGYLLFFCINWKLCYDNWYFFGGELHTCLTILHAVYTCSKDVVVNLITM